VSVKLFVIDVAEPRFARPLGDHEGRASPPPQARRPRSRVTLTGVAP
jgi:hypothetical protein